MTEMKTYTLFDIRAMNPCYDPSEYVPESWTGTLRDILLREDVPAVDRIWFATRPGVLDIKTARLFAVWCARQALALVANPDARSVNACVVSENFVHGLTANDDLAAAYAAAYAAAAYAAARAAPYAAARAAAYDAQVSWFLKNVAS